MSEIDPPFVQLIPDYENAALEALDARDEWLATAARCCDRAVIAAARENWEELERQRLAIMDALEALLEGRIAMRLQRARATGSVSLRRRRRGFRVGELQPGRASILGNGRRWRGLPRGRSRSCVRSARRRRLWPAAGAQAHLEFTARTRLELSAVWNFIEFLLVSLVFTLIGLWLGAARDVEIAW